MKQTTLTSREFNQDVGSAKRAAKDGPVVITDRGTPSHVLLSIDAFRRLSQAQRSIGSLLGSPEAARVDFDVPRVGSESLRVPEFGTQ